MGEVSRNISLKLDEILPTLSVAMIVKNEQENLPELLEILQGTVDEIVVVDTGSTDDTKKIALDYGAKVFDFPWNDNFSDARNESLKHCTKDYIIWMDADDRMNKQDFAKLKWDIQKNLGSAFFIQLLDRRFDKEFTSVQLRVIPNHRDIRFTGKVHEQMSFSVEGKNIPYVTLPITLMHIGYSTPEGIDLKLKRNLKLLIEEVKEKPEDFLINLNLAKSFIGLQNVDDADLYTDKCIDLILENKVNVSRENMYIAILTKINILAIKNKYQDVLILLDKVRYLFQDMDIFKLTYGEACFKNLIYKEAYKNLFFITTGRFVLGLLPLDMKSVMENMILLLLFSSLAVGDKETAEECIQKMLKVQEFRISEDMV